MNYEYLYNDKSVVSVWLDYDRLVGGNVVTPVRRTLNVAYKTLSGEYAVTATVVEGFKFSFLPEIAQRGYYGRGETLFDALYNDYAFGNEKEVLM